MKMMIYVAGPYSADTKEKVDENVQFASSAAQALWNLGHVAICPHLNTYGFEGTASMTGRNWVDCFKLFLVGDFEIISRCDAVFMLPGWENSKGSCAEFVFAHWLGLPVFHSMVEVINYGREATPDGTEVS